MVRSSMLALFTIVLLSPSGFAQESVDAPIRFQAPQTLVMLDDVAAPKPPAMIIPNEVPPPIQPQPQQAIPLPNLAVIVSGLPGVASLNLPGKVSVIAETSDDTPQAVPLILDGQSAQIAMQIDDLKGLAPAVAVPRPILNSSEVVVDTESAEVVVPEVPLKDVVHESGRIFLGRSLHASNWRRQRIASRPMPTERERADKIPAPTQPPEPTDD